MNSPLYRAELRYKVASFQDSQGERERWKNGGFCPPLSVLSIVIPRSHAISDKTGLRVINLPGKLTSPEGTSTLVTTRYSTYVLVGGYNRHINNGPPDAAIPRCRCEKEKEREREIKEDREIFVGFLFFLFTVTIPLYHEGSNEEVRPSPIKARGAYNRDV